jgi:hypothetical protein
VAQAAREFGFFGFFRDFSSRPVSFGLRFAIDPLGHRRNGSPVTAIQFQQLGA